MTDTTTSKDDEKRSKNSYSETSPRGGWRQVDSEIWALNTEPRTGLQRVSHTLRGVAAIFTHPFSAFILGVMAISWSVTGTILAAYYIGGVRFFGPVFLGLWASIIIIGILVIEKSGYGRNFEGWDFPLRKTIALPLAFGLVLAFLYLILLLGNRLR